MNQTKIAHKNMEPVLKKPCQEQPEGHSEGGEQLDEEKAIAKLLEEYPPNCEEPSQTEDVEVMLASGMDDESSVSSNESRRNTSELLAAKPLAAPALPEDYFLAHMSEEELKKQLQANTQGSLETAAGKTSKSCLPTLPSKKENFSFGFDLKLTKSDRRFFCFTICLNLFQKFIAYTAWVDCHGDTYETEYFVNLLTPAVFALTVLFSLPQNFIRKNSYVGFIGYLIEIPLLACFYGRGLHDRREFDGGIDLTFNTVFFVVFMTNLAGDLALLANIVLSEKTLHSRIVYFTTLLFFVVVVLLTHNQIGVWVSVRPVYIVIKGLLFGLVTSSFIAKEVLIFKERRADEGKGTRLGESFYHALTGRTFAFGRQLLLVFSKLFTQ